MVLVHAQRKEKTMPFGSNSMRSQVLYWAAQVYMHKHDCETHFDDSLGHVLQEVASVLSKI